MSETERLIPLRQVGEHVPTRPCYQSVLRWATRGVRGRVQPSRLIGGRRFVELHDLRRFMGDGACD